MLDNYIIVVYVCFTFMDNGCSSPCLQDFVIISLPESFKSDLQCHVPFSCSLFYCICCVSRSVMALLVFRLNFRIKFYFLPSFLFLCRRSRWPRGLRRGSAAARLLGLRVRIPSGHGFLCLMTVTCCAGRAPCHVPVSCPVKFYRKQVCVCVCV